MYNPTPELIFLLFDPLKKGLKTFFISLSGIPIPSSCIDTKTCSCSLLILDFIFFTLTAMLPFIGVNLIALLIKL